MPIDVEKLREELRIEFRKEIASLRSSIERDVRKECRELSNSVEFCSKKFDDIAAEFTALKEENKVLRAENATLSSERDGLKKLVEDFEQRCTVLEQFSRNKNIEIKGVPETEQENLQDTLQRVGEVINESIALDDIDACHRVPTKNTTIPNIIVQFRNRLKRDTVLTKAKKTNMTTSDLGHPGQTSIYINEHLCPALKKLLGMAISRKKEKSWKFVWTRHGHILARRNESSDVVRIACLKDLDKIN